MFCRFLTICCPDTFKIHLSFTKPTKAALSYLCRKPLSMQFHMLANLRRDERCQRGRWIALVATSSLWQMTKWIHVSQKWVFKCVCVNGVKACGCGSTARRFSFAVCVFVDCSSTIFATNNTWHAITWHFNQRNCIIFHRSWQSKQNPVDFASWLKLVEFKSGDLVLLPLNYLPPTLLPGAVHNSPIYQLTY